MSYIEFNFKRFYTGFFRTNNGWVFGFIRYVKEDSLFDIEESSIIKEASIIDEILKKTKDNKIEDVLN